jgi:hypothetical protein
MDLGHLKYFGGCGSSFAILQRSCTLSQIDYRQSFWKIKKNALDLWTVSWQMVVFHVLSKGAYGAVTINDIGSILCRFKRSKISSERQAIKLWNCFI